MSRFVKPAVNTDNVYVEFRFESSLRKYESKPCKKIKCDGSISNCCVLHHFRRVGTNSPVSNQARPHFSKGKVIHGYQKTVEKQSASGLSQSQMVSSNKSAKIPKRKPFQQSSYNKNEFQNKKSASLANNPKAQNKQDNQQLQEELYLNDFQPQLEMDREELGDGDADFGHIQITQNIVAKMEPRCGGFGQREEPLDGVENSNGCNQQDQVRNAQLEQRSNRDQTQKIDQPIREIEQKQEKRHNNSQMLEADQSCKAVEKAKELQIAEQIQQLQQKQNGDAKPITIAQQQPFLKSKTHSSNQVIQTQIAPQTTLNCKQHHENISTQPLDFKRAAPEKDSLISKVIIQKQISEVSVQKCLTFQGGRIYIDSQGQTFYISVRVFNKLRKQCSALDGLISTLIAQRPYLQKKRAQLRAEFLQYLNQL